MKKEKRQLTQREAERLAAFEARSAELLSQGYKRIDLINTVEKANTLGVLYAFVLAVPFIILFVVFQRANARTSPYQFLVFTIGILILIVVHELIHGLTWSCFTPNGFKDIEFGVIWKMLTPYCTCREALSKYRYIAGSLMPGIILGFLPALLSVFTGDLTLFMLGIVMILSAGGDILITYDILRSGCPDDALFIDHPTEVGVVCFTK